MPTKIQYKLPPVVAALLAWVGGNILGTYMAILWDVKSEIPSGLGHIDAANFPLVIMTVLWLAFFTPFFSAFVSLPAAILHIILFRMVMRRGFSRYVSAIILSVSALVEVICTVYVFAIFEGRKFYVSAFVFYGISFMALTWIMVYLSYPKQVSIANALDR